MENFFPHHLPENSIQILLIEKMAVKMGLPSEKVATHWIDMFSPSFRQLWEAGIHDIEDIERRLYTPDPLGTGYANMVASILIGKPDLRILTR